MGMRHLRCRNQCYLTASAPCRCRGSAEFRFNQRFPGTYSTRELFEIGLISEVRVKEFDEGCLVEDPAMDTMLEFFVTESNPLEMERITGGRVKSSLKFSGWRAA